MSHLSVRPATVDDASVIMRFIRDLARFERAEDQVRATEADLRRDGWGPSPRFEALIAEADGSPVGFALYFGNYSTWEGRGGLFVEDLYVDQAARQKGAGRALLAAIARIAVDRGYRRVDLNVLHWNPARAFYHGIGAHHLDEWLPYRLTGDALARLAAVDGADGRSASLFAAAGTSTTT